MTEYKIVEFDAGGSFFCMCGWDTGEVSPYSTEGYDALVMHVEQTGHLEHGRGLFPRD